MPRLQESGHCRHQRPDALQRSLRWLTSNLLVAYLAMLAAQQLWVLLNSDVRELLKRVS